MKLKKILLELDPRRDNSAALQRAASIASRFDADIDAVVCEPLRPLPAAPFAEPVAIATAEQHYRSDIEKWAKTTVKVLEDAGIAVNVTTTEDRPHYEAILTQAEVSDADLIMRAVGEHGRLKRLLLGSNDWDLIRHAKLPLWLVQPNDADDRGANVLAAVDPMHPEDEQMNLDKRVLDFADGLRNALQSSLHVYHTYQATPMIPTTPAGAILSTPEPQFDAGLLEKVESAHKTKLDELLSGYELTDDKVHMLEGDPAAEIESVIAAQGIGIVVAGAISRSWFDRLLIGSTAESLLDAVSCDVVLIKGES